MRMWQGARERLTLMPGSRAGSTFRSSDLRRMRSPTNSPARDCRNCWAPEPSEGVAMQEPTDHAVVSPPVRTLQIEADGDIWKGPMKPKIRLMGRWLERAGFRPGHRVQVKCIAPGVIELRSPDGLIVNQIDRPSSE